ncbi:MAG: tRNA 4-thiouridine(8) synthase ThiI [Clostridia bacterium]|nr:tRNA 4-thiouridine(8) synthase ThiI [Clostridia bacterium]
MKEVILLKNGEIALKGLNRRTFEDQLIKNLRRRLSPFGTWQFSAAQSTVTAIPVEDTADMDGAAAACGKVFGFVGYSKALMTDKDMDVIRSVTGDYLEDALREAKTFKVCAKRADKKFPFTSPEICAEMGGVLLSRFPHLRVDVHDPDLTVNIEVRDKAAFIHGNQQKGAGGMPSGSAGKAAVLISGGIDSPVAAWMMAKRGLQLEAVHFASPPYTSERAEKKVHDLLGKVALYSGRIRLHVVPFTEVQEAIRDNCPEELFTILMRRYMMRIAEQIARQNDCGALITGESVGQVASQTLYALACTDEAVSMPVFRPLIGMDKNEVIEISRRIDTFELSILPYEDCCTVFTPRHPRTHPKLFYVQQAENLLDGALLCAEAVAGTRTLTIRGR